jgi:hypothetical protein
MPTSETVFQGHAKNAAPNLAARIFPQRSARPGLNSGPRFRNVALFQCQLPLLGVSAKATAQNDIFSIGQNILQAGTQTLQKLGKQFEAPPPGFPPGEKPYVSHKNG